jgi:dTDP-4-dehydrorhamnose 3,5-epimerase
MNLVPTALPGAYVIDPELFEDQRGLFARTWDADVFREAGLSDVLVQCSVSFNTRRGTVRGMHYQAAPHEEAKLVRCTAGRMFDVAIDLRPGSPAYRSWVGVELSAENRRALYVPEGCAHGFLTLADATEVLYQMSARHVPEAARGVRWDDPAFGIEWPGEMVVINDRDRTYPDFIASSGERSP